MWSCQTEQITSNLQVIILLRELIPETRIHGVKLPAEQIIDHPALCLKINAAEGQGAIPLPLQVNGSGKGRSG